MNFLCVIGGCSWTESSRVFMGNEMLLHHCCSRCGAHRYLLDSMRVETAALLGNGA
ncbi:MAG TPA: PSPA7_2676 family Cys-rich small protein [Pseudomonas sp.]|uniref:PSPA7_2676 family Cys-rich small protein n=1 Tax=Pseudomonas sp. TaxID=306 RepID=UPI002B6F6A9F|nr:PSPA7_2676 family Cys-rich small protein [Pseudomonas sp.]HSX87468.1 PSPA7_2676 family Cys-rich small protein [Pseudomonas sp.]